MGEAKRRKAADPYYGKIPKAGKALIISNPLEVSEGSVLVRSDQLDDYELRRAILFWDRLLWPLSNGLHIDGGTDAEFLEETGVLKRPVYRGTGDVSRLLADAYIKAFDDMEEAEPGSWALHTGENALLLRSPKLQEGRGASVALFRAVPIPDRTVPLEDILRFREKRLSEVRALVVAIDEFYQEWTLSEDEEHQFHLAVRRIEHACYDLLRVSKESKHPFRLSNWKIGFSLNPMSAIGAAAIGKTLDPIIGLDGLGAILGGAASTLSLQRDIGFKVDEAKTKPFNFAVSLEKDLM